MHHLHLFHCFHDLDSEKNLSLSRQDYTLVDHVTTGKTQNQITAAIFLGIEKAFNKVCIFNLIYKPIKYYFSSIPY